MNNNSSHYRYPVERPGFRASRVALLSVMAILAMLLVSCADGGDGATATVDIVATTTVLGDVAGAIAGDTADVTVLLPRGADPHDYQASSREVAAIMNADLVIANGLGLEQGLQDVLTAAEAEGVNVLWTGEHVDPLPFGDADHADADHAADGGLDPHFWLDPARMALAIDVIAAQLEASHPGEGWSERAAAYVNDLTTLDTEITAILAGVPQEQRTLVTGHDSLRYFAARYGFEVIGTVVPGGSTLADPSSAEMAALINTIEREGVPAIFTEVFESEALAAALAAESDTPIAVVPLHTGSLGEAGSAAGTYLGMIRDNAERIAEALS